MSIKYVIILVIIFILITNFNKKEQFKDYYKCNDYKLNKPLYNMINTFNINKNYELSNSELYIPCTYTSSEIELANKDFNKNQSIFAVSGCDNIVSKNNLWKLIKDKYGREIASKIMPESYLTYDENDMNLFMNRYKPDKFYILKKNLQRKEGLLLTKNFNEIINSNKDGYKVIQDYITNIITINKRKLNLRLYFVVICHEKHFGCYLYNEGKCIYANKDYDEKSDDIHSHITSLDLEYEIYDSNPLTLSELKKYMLESKMDYNFLWRKINLNLKSVCNSFRDSLCKSIKLQSNLTFQIFGPDFVIDSLLNPYILEINKGPSMKAYLDKDVKIKDNLYVDTISLVKYFCKKFNINKTFEVNKGYANNFTKIYEI